MHRTIIAVFHYQPPSVRSCRCQQIFHFTSMWIAEASNPTIACYIFPNVNLRSFEHQQKLYVCIWKEAATHCQLPTRLQSGLSPWGALHTCSDTDLTHRRQWVRNNHLSTSCLISLICLSAACFIFTAVKFKQGTDLLKLQVSLSNKPFQDFLLYGMVSIQ